MHPFIRYDVLNFTENNPFYALVNNGYIYEVEYASIGINWDWHHFNRLKLEYGEHRKGPRKNQILLQTAWAF